MTWIFKGHFPDNIISTILDDGSNKHKLVIVSAKEFNEGTYICQGKDSNFDKNLFFSSETTIILTKDDDMYYW